MKLKELTKRDFRKLVYKGGFKSIILIKDNIPQADGAALFFKPITTNILNMIQNTLVIDNFSLIKNGKCRVYTKDNIRCTCSDGKILIKIF